PTQDRKRRRVLRAVAVVERDHDRPPYRGAPVAGDLVERGAVVSGCRERSHLRGKLVRRDIETREGRIGGRPTDHVVHQDGNGSNTFSVTARPHGGRGPD